MEDSIKSRMKYDSDDIEANESRQETEYESRRAPISVCACLVIVLMMPLMSVRVTNVLTVFLNRMLGNPTFQNIIRGAILRVVCDLTGGTPLECLKNRVTVSTDSCFQSFKKIIREDGVLALWTGTSSRTIEGALLGAFFMIGSEVTKKQVISFGGTSVMASLAGGLVGGLAQAIVMTPAGLVFTSLNVNKDKPGFKNDSALRVTRRILRDKGIQGMFAGGGAMAFRQASNWASRSCLTEIFRSSLKMSDSGVMGEIGSGVIGGLGSCWNTPVEVVRVLTQKDASVGKQPKSFTAYMEEVYNREGVRGLFRGVTPRGIQAIWQTVFMVALPNILGV